MSPHAAAPSPLRTLITDTVTPNRLRDVAWLRQYLDAGAPAGEPIMLSLGEAWEHAPTGLLDALSQVPRYSHGYQISMYGLPLLRQELKRYVAETQRLPEDSSWELAVSWTGTRSAMRDFGALLRGGTMLAVAPAWDYAGVYAPMGFDCAYVPFDPAEHSGPSPAKVRRTAAAIDDLALVVLNTQHNPTGANWSRELVTTMIDVAMERGAAILIDDAYYGMCPTTATSALALLLDRLGGSPSPVPWLAVRSLGKQFRCNGWALGAAIGAPDLLDHLVNEVRPQHTFNYAIHLQWAMATWLADRAAVSRYLDDQQNETARKRAAVLDWLPPSVRARSIAGPGAPYVLYPVPERIAVEDYLRRALLECGVALSDAWPLARQADTPPCGYVRMYLGPSLRMLRQARDRLATRDLWPV